MSLSSNPNTINALGIFGRHEPKQEKYFKSLSDRYSRYHKNNDALGIFNHLSLVITKNTPVGEIPKYLDLLRELKPFLPLRIKVSGVIVKDGKHLALSFDTKQTEQVRKLAGKLIPAGVVTTYYTKVVWFVPKEKQEEVIKILKRVKEMIVYDFILVANRQDDAHTIYSSNRYK
jgi:hypothetical protein